MTQPTPRRAVPGDVGRQTARGFAWLFGQSIGDKLVTLAGQIVLARLLTKDDFKLVALTYTVSTFAGLLQQAGIGQVLIQRHGRFHLWATTAFWMSLAVGLSAGVLTAAIAPAAAAFYGQPALKGLLLMAAITLPINGLMTVPEAKLRAEMRFKFLAALAMLAVVCTTGLSIILAEYGYGAYSFILPPAAVSLLRVIIMWWWARPRVKMQLHLRRWKYLVTDSTMLLIGSIALMVTYQGGPAILGRLYPTIAAAGVFYFAWNLSDQSLRLLVNNLAGVLFPALSTLREDPARQRVAFLRTVRVLLLVGTPLCLIQAVLAGPVIRLVFSSKWTEAIPVMAALCLGMTARSGARTVREHLLAQRRYATFMKLALGYAVVFIAVVAGAALWAGADHAATGAAIGAGICLGLLGPTSLRVALGRGSWREVGKVYWVPLLTGAAAFGPGVVIVRMFPATKGGDFCTIAAAGVVCSGLYGLGMWMFARADFLDVVMRLKAVLKRGPKYKPGHCASCGYDMSGLEGGVCPECGNVGVVPG